MLYDQFNRPIQRPEKKPDRRPLAAAPLSDAWRDYVADGLTPERLAALFKNADAGDVGSQAELFDQIEERDGHIIGEISKRRNVILDADLTLEPASDDGHDQNVYESVKAMLDNITDWEDVLVAMQDGVGKGFAAVELGWDVSEGQAMVDRFNFLEQKRFRFTDRSGMLSRVPLLITDDDPIGVDIPAFRVMMHRYGGRSGHVTRSGLYRICAWWYLFKNYSIKDWVIFCEVYGMPLRLGKYDTGASEDDRSALEIAVRTLGTDAAGIISKATEIEFITGASGSVSADLYQSLASFANKEISKAILGGTLTAEVDGKGSYAAANTHNDVRHDLINADARALAATIRDQLIRPYVGYNFGWDTPVPKYRGRFQRFNSEEHAQMLDRFADRMDIPVAHVREKFGIPAPEKDEICLKPKNIPQTGLMESRLHVAGKPANDSRKENLAFLDMISNDLGEQADDHMEHLLKPVRKIMNQCRTMEEFRERLLDAFSQMESERLGILIEQAMATAELGGRYEVNTDG